MMRSSVVDSYRPASVGQGAKGLLACPRILGTALVDKPLGARAVPQLGPSAFIGVGH